MESKTKYLGIDFGSKRLGIAVSDEDKKYSFSRDHVENDSRVFEKLLAIIKEENISRIIIGYPLNLKSEKTIQTFKVIEFKETLEAFLNKNYLNLEINFFDERFTSSIAQSHLINSGLKRKTRQRKELVDDISAQIILQDYIDKTKNQTIIT